jgi:CRISPR-associated protein (TIGR02584 family)
MTGDRVLVCLAGLSPQVVTETIWALGVAREPRWIPQHLVIVTTTEGAERIAATLLDAQTGALRALAEEYPDAGLGGLVEMCEIRLLGDPPDEALTDLADADSVRTAADSILELIRNLTAEPDRELQLSIAGGRKSLGALAALALSLFGRAQDAMSHVLVNEAFTGHPAFFFPPREPRSLLGTDGRVHSTAEALVSLVEIPFPRLRAVLPPAAFRAVDFRSAMDAAQRGIETPLLTVDLDNAAACWGEEPLHLPPALLALLAALAVDALAQGTGLNRCSTPQSALLPLYARLARPAFVERAERVWGEPIEPERMEQLVSRLNKLVRLAGVSKSGDMIVLREGERAHARYRLALPAARIVLVGL